MFVEIAEGELVFFVGVGHKFVGKAVALVLFVETEHGVEVRLETQSGSEIAVGIKHVAEHVGKEFLRHFARAYGGVLARHLCVDLHVARNMSAKDILGGERDWRDYCHSQPQQYFSFH